MMGNYPMRAIENQIMSVIDRCGRLFSCIVVMTAGTLLAAPISDSIMVDSLYLMSPDAVSLPISFVNTEPLAAIELTLGHNSPDLQIDSFSFEGSRLSYIGLKGAIPTGSTIIIFAFQALEEPIPAGRGLLGTLHASFRPEAESQTIRIDTISVVNGLIEHGTYFTDSTVRSFVPHFVPGRIRIGNSCCIGSTGNIDGSEDELTDLGDLTALIDYLFISFGELSCPEEANIDGSEDGIIDLGDLTHLIAYLFINPGLVQPAPCR